MTEEPLLTTSAAAALLGTSRQHIVNLCERGELTCVSVGTHRRVPQAQIEELRGRSSRMTRDQVRSLWLGYAVAGRLVERPDETLAKARQNLRHLQSIHVKGQAAHWLREWERLLDGPVEGVLHALTSATPHSRELRQNSPFAGVLQAEQREAVLDAFVSAANVSTR